MYFSCTSSWKQTDSVYINKALCDILNTESNDYVYKYINMYVRTTSSTDSTENQHQAAALQRFQALLVHCFRGSQLSSLHIEPISSKVQTSQVHAQTQIFFQGVGGKSVLDLNVSGAQKQYCNH